AILPKPSPAKTSAAPNPHRRPNAHRFPAGSFFGGFRTPALYRVDRSRRAAIRNPSRTLPLDLGPANGRSRRISLVAGRPGEGPLTEPAAAAQPRRQEPPFMPHSRPSWQRNQAATPGGGGRSPRGIWATRSPVEPFWEPSRKRELQPIAVTEA